MCGMFLMQHFFASFLSRDEAYRLIMDGWVQHSSYAKCFLSGQESLASFAVVNTLLMFLDIDVYLGVLMHLPLY